MSDEFTGVGAGAYAGYLDAIASADRTRAVSIARAELARGVPARDVLLDLVCPAQQEVGRLWQGNTWNVAREHAATAISEAVVGAVTVGAADTGDAPPRTASRGTVVVACVEDEWHVLPARVVAEVLILAGWRVIFLGASTPAAHLAQFVHDTGPDAVALSCSVPSTLPKARRLIEAAREAGVPVMVGGRAFGPDDHRARRLGANAWAATASDAVEVLAQLGAYASPPPPLRPSDDYAALTLRAAELQDRAVRELAGRSPLVAAYTSEQLARTREDIGHIVAFLAAALYVEDERIMSEFVGWLREVLTTRGVPAAAVDAGLDAVAAAVAELPLASAVLHRARDGGPTG
jgi:methanogenic corrinoid protein MtbC1